MARLGLKRGERLCTAAGFSRVFAKARPSRDPYFTVLARAGQTSGARLGLVVAKRTEKRAVGRHRIKRLIRESFRHHKAELGGQDCVVIARPAAARAPNAALLDSLRQHWNRIAIH